MRTILALLLCVLLLFALQSCTSDLPTSPQNDEIQNLEEQDLDFDSGGADPPPPPPSGGGS